MNYNSNPKKEITFQEIDNVYNFRVILQIPCFQVWNLLEILIFLVECIFTRSLFKMFWIRLVFSNKFIVFRLFLIPL